MATIQDRFESWTEEMRNDMQSRRRETRERFRRVTRALPYAALGSTIHGVERTRKAISRTFELPSRLIESTREAPERWAETFEARAERGRRIVSRIRERDGVRHAADGFGLVRREAKATATSARRAANAAAEALEDAAEAVFDPHDNRPYEERTCEELRALASERAIQGRSGMNKAQLIKALRKSR